ncbi:hypothetical protein HN51_021094 [Arachis hypogaea]|uniref:Pre-rRNA-processing protein RIX1 N-terminal domain-containing protein n=1 Tax=Arachis hypogaea TaxID=3818 RepID=A0A445EI37_ARAHY|nr:proline-, glutamic acid- and leucine-rich protein 1 [Arachis hypogaea]QHO52025.1 Proline-, glutamic acid- and leucine-rich protein [Arachis hypogaea]RYR75071.1 hypothetical protein Ahy_A02g009771 [Arachis hypogaea]
MSAFDFINGVYDAAFKPRLLLSIVRDHLPDSKRPFSNHSSTVSKVVYLVKTHRLLSESFTDSMDPKVVEAWKSAVTTWVERILELLDSPVSDKCWVGISLLGVTCQLCSPVRFVESFVPWFQKLLPSLRSQEESSFLRVAACASMSDMFARLSKFPKFKKDGTACAPKVVQPVLKLLSDSKSDVVWESAINLLCTIITTFQSSINQNNYESIECAIAIKLLSKESNECSPDIAKKLAYCLALLPKSKADEESWSVMLQKLLVLINDQLNFAFQGLEEATVRNQITRLLVLPGKPLPSPLGGNILAEEIINRKWSEQSPASDVPTLIFACCTMLTSSYPVKVKIPVRLLLALAERMLMVNGSLPQMSFPFTTARQQEDICSVLPSLHLCSLELLDAIIKAMGSQLLPHAGSIARIITKYFKDCALPELRIKFYSVTRTLLLSMGVGMAMYLAQEVVNNAFSDLETIDNKSGGASNGSNPNASAGSLPAPSRRKRKHKNASGPLQENDDGGLGAEVLKNNPSIPISLRIAALEALETLITVAGSLRFEPWRSKVDDLVFATAMDSFKEESASSKISEFQQEELAEPIADLQLAALRTLLASFLSFARIRPPYLSEGLDLFRRGKQQTGTKVAEFCMHALLALEVLIHPRELPLPNYVSTIENEHNFRDENSSWSNRGPVGFRQVGFDTPDTVDDLYAKWMENATGTGTRTNVSIPKNTVRTDEPSEAIRDTNHNVLSGHQCSGTEVQERNEIAGSDAPTNADVEMRAAEDEFVSKSDKPVESMMQSQEPVSNTTIIPVDCEPVATEVQPERIVSDRTTAHNEGSSRMELGEGSSANKVSESASPKITPDTIMIQESAFKLNLGDSVAHDDFDLPEIVDADPDTDSE